MWSGNSALSIWPARAVLVQSRERILPAFPEGMSAQAHASLEELGVEFRTGGRVRNIAETQVLIGDDDLIETEAVLWAAGVAASPVTRWLDAKADRSGRVEVNDRTRVIGVDGEALSHIYAIGDTAGSLA